MSDSQLTLVSWSHADPADDSRGRQARAARVRGLADLLRHNGVDARLDLYHSNEGVDWTRWGPRLASEAKVVLVLVSPGWSAAWEGTGYPTMNAGAFAEANVLRSMMAHDRADFVRRVRVVRLPGEHHYPVPFGLDVATRYDLSSIDEQGAVELLRDLTGQPRHPMPPLGPVPPLPPEPPTSSEPGPGPNEGPSYEALPDPPAIRWRGDQRSAGGHPTSVLVHMQPHPVTPIPFRVIGEISDRLPEAIRSLALVTQDSVIQTYEHAEGIEVEVGRPRRRFGEAYLGGVSSVGLNQQGQMSVAWVMPSDSMGAVLDEAWIRASVERSLRLAASAWVGQLTALAISVEITPAILLTDGSLDELGRRSQASMGLGARDLRWPADEIVRTTDLSRDADAVAGAIAPAVVRRWRAQRHN